MCGILGFTGSPDNHRLQTMLGSITHRGPDGEAMYESEHFQLGMRRLSIIDLVTPNLYPVKNETQTINCILNGEIYNYKALREELKTYGHEFKTDSDSEVIVHGYEEWGEKVVTHLRGMFGFALHDSEKDVLFVARDRLGIKPMYYAEFNGRIVFGSEIKALFAGWEIDRSPDDVTVLKFLLTRVHDDTKHTFFREVKRLLPGHFMILDAQGNYHIEKYWLPETTSDFKSSKPDKYYADSFREKFLESMKLHLIADVPLGITLSGGLDSSAVASLARKLIDEGTDMHTEGNKLMTFSALHPGETIDESEYINEVVKSTNAEAHSIVPDVHTFWGELDEWVHFQEEPTISTAPYAYYTVMREAHKYVKVLLSGQGGDELLAGYIPYFAGYISSARDAGAYWEILRESVRGFDLYAPFIKQKLDSMIGKSKQLSVRELLNVPAEFDQAAKDRIEHKHLQNLNERLLFDVTQGSVPSLLRYEDKNSMAHSIESRVPFLDHEFVEFVFGLPIDQKIKMGWNRYVYREAMKGLMPDKNRLRRNKIGFVNSEWEWLQAKSQEILEIFNSEQFRSRKYWNADKVISEFAAWLGGQKHGDGLMFWRILSTELWLRRFGN